MAGAELPPPPSDASADSPADNRPWYRQLNRYHWFVLMVAALGWLFDTMDQQLFTLARVPAMRELLAPAKGLTADPVLVSERGAIATSVFLIGWAMGGLIFGILGDRIGRARTMLWTILIYSLCTGLSAMSIGFWDFVLYRFLTGLGVGGEFAVGVALVAEVMPARARPFALGLLQASSAFGNILAALASLWLTELEYDGTIGSAWRYMFVIGTLPALLAILIRRRLKEPERWQSLSDDELKRKLGSYGELFSHPVWRRNALFGLVLAFSGVVGLWGIGFFSADLVQMVFRPPIESALIQNGEAELDRAFVRSAVFHPPTVEALEDFPPPNFLLSQADHKGDAENVIKAVADLTRGKKPVNFESVLDRLDVMKIANSPDIRERRLKFLDPDHPPALNQLEQLWQEQKLGGDAALTGSGLKAFALRIKGRGRKVNLQVSKWTAVNGIMLNIGAFFGIYAFTYFTHFVGRRGAFAAAYLGSFFTTILVFACLKSPSDIFWMSPLMGFAQLSLFGGFAIYFPELFPTHLRSTGTSFCYNVGRFVAAIGPFTFGYLQKVFVAKAEPIRWAGVSMCLIFLLGLAVVPLIKETRNEPLPE